MRMGCRLAIAGKGQHIGSGSVLLHVQQAGFEGGTYFLTGGTRQLGTEILVETTFTVNAIERTELAVGRHQVDSQRNAQAAGMHGSEDRGRIDDGHNYTICFLRANVGVFLFTSNISASELHPYLHL